MVFSDRAMVYRGKEIAYDDATGIAFSQSNRSGRFLYHNRGSVLVHSPSVGIKMRFAYDGICSGGAKWAAMFALDKATNYRKISEMVLRQFGPHILARMVATIMQGCTARIGSLEFDRKGITNSGVFGTRKRANWGQLPEVRSTSKAPWYSYTSTSGIIEISYQHPPTGQMVVIGTTSSAEKNGCLVTLLIETMKGLLAQQPS